MCFNLVKNYIKKFKVIDDSRDLKFQVAFEKCRAYYHPFKHKLVALYVGIYISNSSYKTDAQIELFGKFILHLGNGMRKKAWLHLEKASVELNDFLHQ